MSISALPSVEPSPPRHDKARPAERQRRIDELLAQMTLEEKLGQMSQHSIGMEPMAQVTEAVRQGLVGSCINASLEQRNELQKVAVEESRLGIPILWGRDVIHGYRTMFPIPLGQAASFNPTLVEKAAEVAAREASSAGVDWALAPMVDVTRDPRWGRIAETCGEDPHLSAELGAAMVRGFQGKDYSEPTRVAACAKHFVGYGAAEAGKDYNTTSIPEQQLREIYLPSFRACVDAGVATVMSAFNELNGVPASANEFTLRQILKGEFDFNGFVVSDWASVTETIAHGLCADEREAARESVRAGVDMEMATRAYLTHVGSLIDSGELSLSVVDDAVRRILAVKLQRGLFERPYVDASMPSVMLTPEHREVARLLAEESAVLLKNEAEVLPLSTSLGSLAVIGSLADSASDQLGCWTMDGLAEDVVTTLSALRSRFPKLALHHAPGTPSPRSLDCSGIAAAVKAAEASEAVLLFVGEDAAMSGESKSRAVLNLPGAQDELIAAVAKTGKPIVMVVMSGRPLAIGEAFAQAQAVLWAWHNGTMGGPAIVNLLFGERAPSGKLPVSIPRAVGQIPIYYSHKQTGRPPKTERQAGVPLGTPLDPTDFCACYLDVESSPLFCFGFGLTYGRIEYSDLRVVTPKLPASGSLEVTALVHNDGQHTVEEVVQLYTRDLVASVTRPVKELKGFQRVRLAPGDKKVVNFRLAVSALAFPGRTGKTVLEPGKFQVWIGGSSDTTLRGDFEVI